MFCFAVKSVTKTTCMLGGLRPKWHLSLHEPRLLGLIYSPPHSATPPHHTLMYLFRHSPSRGHATSNNSTQGLFGSSCVSSPTDTNRGSHERPRLYLLCHVKHIFVPLLFFHTGITYENYIYIYIYSYSKNIVLYIKFHYKNHWRFPIPL